LRDIEACLRAAPQKLYHMGLRGLVSRNTLANANQVRDWRIYADFAHTLIQEARRLYKGEPFGMILDQTVYALDATTIDLCLSLFPWAQFRRHKSAVKLHTLLDLRGSIPTVVIVTGGQIHEVNILDQLIWEAGAIYLMDRAYVDFRRLYRLHQSGAFFVTRAKKRFDCRRLYSQRVDKQTGLQCDQIVVLNNPIPKRGYPERLRRVRYYDVATQKRLVFLTNNFLLPPLTITQLYQCRWQVELFFRWIKQHLRIKAFYGTSQNAVRTQVWIAIAVYVLVAIIKKRLNLDHSLHSILQILSVSLFEKLPIQQLFSQPQYDQINYDSLNQLILFD
ncbi:MAG TPA: IS4 family transposase, partial [Candidatus Acidoferrum sp.]|nr:IS4 family transposase [Candidatus Acidoferrum sp.]